MFKDALDAAVDNGDKLTELRASLGTSNLLIAIDQCSGNGDELQSSQIVLAHAEELLSNLSGIQRTHGEVRIEQARAELAWCRWRAGDLDRESALAQHDQAVDAIAGASGVYFEDLQANLLAESLFQRAELRAGVDLLGCEQDLAKALDLAPRFAQQVYEAQSTEWSCTA